MKSKTIIKYQNSFIKYQKSFAKHGVSHKALAWKSELAAARRYEQIVTDLDFNDKTILDVGCGFGDIIPFIESKSNNFDYTGIDITSEFIAAAKQKFPKYNFLNADYFGNPIKKKFDIVISSGALNSNFNNQYKYRESVIETLWGSAKEAVAFNMAGANPQPKNKKTNRVYYVDSLKILKYCFTLTSKIIFRHHYHPKDFSIVMYK